MGHSIATRNNILRLSILSVALFVSIFSAQALVQQSFAGHPENPDPPDLQEFALAKPEPSSFSSGITIFSEATMTLLSESSSGTVRLTIFLSEDSSSSTIQSISGLGCIFNEDPFCTINQLFTALEGSSDDLPEGQYLVTAKYTSNNEHAVPLMISDDATHTLDRTPPLAPGTPSGDQLINAAEEAAGVTYTVTGIDSAAVAVANDPIFLIFDDGTTDIEVQDTITGADIIANSISILVPAGTLSDAKSYTLTARVDDAAENTGAESSGITVDTDFTAPSAPSGLKLTAATDTGTSQVDLLTKDRAPDVTGTAEDGSTVEIFDTDGTTSLGTGGASTFTITVNKDLSEGAHTIRAETTDPAGNTSPRSTLGIIIDITPPEVVTAPSTTRTEAITQDAAFTNVDYTDYTVSDDNGFQTPTCTGDDLISTVSTTSGSFPKGVTEVSCQATDNADNTNTPTEFSVAIAEVVIDEICVTGFSSNEAEGAEDCMDVPTNGLGDQIDLNVKWGGVDTVTVKGTFWGFNTFGAGGALATALVDWGDEDPQQTSVSNAELNDSEDTRFLGDEDAGLDFVFTHNYAGPDDTAFTGPYDDAEVITITMSGSTFTSNQNAQVTVQKRDSVISLIFSATNVPWGTPITFSGVVKDAIADATITTSDASGKAVSLTGDGVDAHTANLGTGTGTYTSDTRSAPAAPDSAAEVTATWSGTNFYNGDDSDVSGVPLSYIIDKREVDIEFLTSFSSEKWGTQQSFTGKVTDKSEDSAGPNDPGRLGGDDLAITLPANEKFDTTLELAGVDGAAFNTFGDTANIDDASPQLSNNS